MDERGYHYYEANAASINLEEITSSAENANTLQRLRDGDPTLSHFYLGRATWNGFIIGEGDDLGWLGYFIGKSQYLRHLSILYLPDGEQHIDVFTFLEGIARSQSIRHIGIIHLNNDGLTSVARALAGNNSVRSLYLEELGDDVSVTSAGCVAFSTALCDTSSVNSTYLSNHTICKIRLVGGDGAIDLPQVISLHLQLNEEHPQYAARCKILMKHRSLDMTPFLHWGLKFLPFAVDWFEGAKPCTMLTIYDANSASMRRVLDETDEAFESRELTALYEFVRGMPEDILEKREELILVAYDDKIAMAEEEIKMLREDVEERDMKITQLEEENKMLREDVEQRDRKITQLEEENKILSKIVVCNDKIAMAEEEMEMLQIKMLREDVEQRVRKILTVAAFLSLYLLIVESMKSSLDLYL